MRTSFWVTLGVSTLFTVVGLSTTDALAWTVRSFSPLLCKPMPPTPIGLTGEISSEGQLVNYTPDSWLTVGCPISSDTSSISSTQWSAITGMARVYGWSNGNGGITATHCRTYYTGSGGTCGVTGTSLSGVVGVNTASAGGGGEINDAFYVKVVLGTGSALFSYTLEHP